jgi:DNA-binding NarL/FixJ family response regulator
LRKAAEFGTLGPRMTTLSPIAVMIVEDQPRLRDGLALLIDTTPGYRTIGSFGSMEDALGRPGAPSPDVALVDIQLPGMSGIQGLPLLRQRHPGVQILMLTVQDNDDSVFEAICAGATGYLLKDTPPARLLEAVRELYDGGAPMSPGVARRVLAMFKRPAPSPHDDHGLSPRELDVLRLLADGHSYKTAAATLDLSLDTVRTYIRRIYEKLHVHTKSEAVTKAIRHRIV